MKKKEMFVLTAFHCSGGHGDTFSVLGVFDDLGFVLARIRDLQCGENMFRMDSIDHGFFVHEVDLNQPYLSRSGPKCICSISFRRHNGEDLKWLEAWFSQPYYEAMKKVGHVSGIFTELR